MKVMVIVKANADSEAGRMPSEQELATMGAYNEQLVAAGIMLAGEGLHATQRGRRVHFGGGTPRVESGPFGPAGEQIAGFWLWDVRSLDEATEWASRAGVGPGLQAVLASYLPELGKISGKAVASLVGVAPMSHDSGTLRGKRSIHGGRAEIRQVLYMASMSAMRHEPRLRDFYQSLRARGKEGKVAIVAVMRKMLVILNARMRDAQGGSIPA